MQLHRNVQRLTPRDECLNLHRFEPLAEAKPEIEDLRRGYNETEPHMVLNALTSGAFARQRSLRPKAHEKSGVATCPGKPRGSLSSLNRGTTVQTNKVTSVRAYILLRDEAMLETPGTAPEQWPVPTADRGFLTRLLPTHLVLARATMGWVHAADFEFETVARDSTNPQARKPNHLKGVAQLRDKLVIARVAHDNTLVAPYTAHKNFLGSWPFEQQLEQTRLITRKERSGAARNVTQRPSVEAESHLAFDVIKWPLVG
ncbi:integrase core domain-containing protein [Paraburkholderia sp. BR10879]|uniref:integrase core domain-containing protein n=1 Tax=Paraburkholderia sp. BR10879 TaxID=3236990 RepID=UPI00397E0B50